MLCSDGAYYCSQLLLSAVTREMSAESADSSSSEAMTKLNFDMFAGPVTLPAGVVLCILLGLYRQRKRFSPLFSILLAALLVNLNPLYVVLFVCAWKLGLISVNVNV